MVFCVYGISNYRTHYRTHNISIALAKHVNTLFVSVYDTSYVNIKIATIFNKAINFNIKKRSNDRCIMSINDSLKLLNKVKFIIIIFITDFFINHIIFFLFFMPVFRCISIVHIVHICYKAFIFSCSECVR